MALKREKNEISETGNYWLKLKFMIIYIFIFIASPLCAKMPYRNGTLYEQSSLFLVMHPPRGPKGRGVADRQRGVH